MGGMGTEDGAFMTVASRFVGDAADPIGAQVTGKE